MLMGKSAVFCITVAVALGCALIPEMLDGFSRYGSKTRAAGAVFGGTLALLALSWSVAGLIYMLSRRTISREALLGTAIITSIVIALFAFAGRGL